MFSFSPERLAEGSWCQALLYPGMALFWSRTVVHSIMGLYLMRRWYTDTYIHAKRGFTCIIKLLAHMQVSESGLVEHANLRIVVNLGIC